MVLLVVTTIVMACFFLNRCAYSAIAAFRMPAATTLGDAIEEAMRCSAGPSQYLSVAEIERRILAMGNCPTLKRPENLPTSISNYLRNNQSSKEGDDRK